LHERECEAVLTRTGDEPVRPVRVEALPRRDGHDRRAVRAGSEDARAPGSRPTGDPRESGPPGSSWPSRDLAGLSILIVDDDEGSLEYFAMALTMAGAAVATASTAVDALRTLSERRPDVVLSDIAMPGHDGYWLVREIHVSADPAIRRVPVVATTAYGRVHSRDAALAAGFVDHLAKPVEPDLLRRTIARAAGRTG
jgi:CheY-like chemotaxis protein